MHLIPRASSKVSSVHAMFCTTAFLQYLRCWFISKFNFFCLLVWLGVTDWTGRAVFTVLLNKDSEFDACACWMHSCKGLSVAIAKNFNLNNKKTWNFRKRKMAHENREEMTQFFEICLVLLNLQFCKQWLEIKRIFTWTMAILFPTNSRRLNPLLQTWVKELEKSQKRRYV